MGDDSDYWARIERVTNHIHDHLDGVLDLDQLARIACFSPFHFHRIYHGFVGETVRDTVRRLRLHRAAIELSEGQMPIERVARRAGYTSQAAFTRAFRSTYGRPPGRYQATAADRLDQKRRTDMYEVRTIDREPIPVAALAHSGDYQAIGRTFERLVGVAGAAGLLRPDVRTFGIYYDDPAAKPTSELRSEACLEVSPNWTAQGELRRLEIAAGRYATIEHVGPYAELPQAYAWLYGTWLPSSGVEVADRPCVEEYLNDPRQVPAHQLRTTIWLPLA